MAAASQLGPVDGQAGRGGADAPVGRFFGPREASRCIPYIRFLSPLSVICFTGLGKFFEFYLHPHIAACAGAFFIDGAFLAADSKGANGWYVKWPTPANDDRFPHTITATAVDTAGQTASHSIGVFVDNVGPDPF